MQEFLRAILAGEGQYCIVGLKKGDARPAIQSFTPNLQETKTAIDTFVAERRDVYFALATFKNPDAVKPRAQENVHQVKSLWVDLDCGELKAKEGKGYIDKEAALLDLERFLEETSMPEPAIVDSGGGIHAYWVFDKAVSYDEWFPLATSFKSLCVKHNLLIDPSCTADGARILRVPDTYNFKDGMVRPVRLLVPPDTAYDIEALKQTIPQVTVAPSVPLPAKKALSPLTQSLMGNRIVYFKNIMMRAKEGTGCQQLQYVYENRTDPAKVGYDLWRAALSIAEHCEDRDKAIHKISEGHPDYDPAKTEEKASDTRGENKGPYLCARFEEYRAGGCDGCPHKGKIKSPISLGTEIAKSEDKEVVVKQETSSGVEEIIYDIPDLPEPYFRGKYGGIYRRMDDGDARLVYPHDLFVIQRIVDPNVGESAWLRLHLPKDGVKNFTVGMASLLSKDTLRTELASRGVITYGKAWDEILAYIATTARELQVQKRADNAYHQFGWVINSKSKEFEAFVVGDIEVREGKKRYVPPTSSTNDMISWFESRGDMDLWKECFNAYSKDGYEAHAFAALSAFGAPLLKRATNHKGVLLNLINPKSGTGKSTILRVINSVWGHPELPLRMPDDTKNALVQRMGILNNLPLTVDELSNMKPEEVSNFLYGITQGRGKDRMEANTNSLRANLTTWATIGILSGNDSFYNKLNLIKNLPEGEIFRCVEYEINKVTTLSMAEGRALFDEQLMNNYGHAWYPYITALQARPQAVLELVEKYTNMFTNKLNLEQEYRFYAALGGCNLAGGHIAKELGLIDYDLRREAKFYAGVVNQIRESTITKPEESKLDLVSQYILKNIQNSLVIESTADLRAGGAPLPIREPRGELLIRMEPDTKHIYLIASHFKRYIAEAKGHYANTLKALQEEGCLLKTTRKGMSKGTYLNTPPIDVLILDAEKMGVEIPIANDEPDNV
jgi:hypothetical protein